MSDECMCRTAPELGLLESFLGSGWLANAVLDGYRAELGTAIILLSAAVKQYPAGTLPSDDRELALLAGCRSVDEWKDMRRKVLFGWLSREYEDASTGERVWRLVHPVIDRHLIDFSGEAA